MLNRHLYILCATLFFAGLGLFLYKAVYLGFPLMPGQKTDVWEVEVKINFSASGRPVKALLYVPRTSADFSIINENFISKGYGISISTVDGNRQVAWSIRNARGQQTLYYHATIEKMVTGEPPATSKNVKLVPSEYEGADLEAATAILLEAKQKSYFVQYGRCLRSRGSRWRFCYKRCESRLSCSGTRTAPFQRRIG
ncbi:MAG: hypothetical protein A2W69_04580 [Gammaproteobacteria bacterium RIFCSPLOWO2_02_47_7]|nr:MAG: hypothetical protein A2W69_04580 [Gammaproteobacteria bacterium RIFCSPLOWO2_02_47_7]